GHILGHEFAGTIAELGRDVVGWRLGQPVAVNPLGGCGSCPVWRQGLPFLCDQLANLGLTAPGGFADPVAVPPTEPVALPGGTAARDAVAACASTLAVGGTLVEVALPDGPGAVPVRSFVTRSLRLVGSCAYGVEEYRRAVELLDSGGLDVGPLVSERVPLSG